MSRSCMRKKRMRHFQIGAAHWNVFGIGGVIASSILVSTSAAGQVNSAPLPASVKEYVALLNETCRDLGERPDRTLAYMKRVDVTGDKIPDYVIDDGDYMCGATPSMLAGVSGAGNTVFVGNAQGGAALAYEEGAGMGIRVGRSRAGHMAALVSVAEGCGATAKAGSCERPLIWNASTKKMSFGPPQSPGW